MVRAWVERLCLLAGQHYQPFAMSTSTESYSPVIAHGLPVHVSRDGRLTATWVLDSIQDGENELSDYSFLIHLPKNL